ncbi:MAG: HAD hydrolase-like protein, partial [Sciscionella sp.]|nr:HAD hydrolase-like protein [Sciscionella sp.]
ERAAGARRPLVVGDRLDTDIAGALAAGMDSLLVLSGATTPMEVLAAQHNQRPKYLVADLRGVLAPAAELAIREQSNWLTWIDDGVLVVKHNGGPRDRLSLLRALCACWWAEGDGNQFTLRAADQIAKTALLELYQRRLHYQEG